MDEIEKTRGESKFSNVKNGSNFNNSRFNS